MNFDNVKDILKYLVPIMSISVIADAVRFNLLQQLRVLGDLNTSTGVSICGLFLGVVMADLLRFKTSMGIYGVATGITSGIALAGASLMYRWCHRIQAEKIKEITESPLPQSSFSFSSCTATLFNRCRTNTSESRKSDDVLEPLSTNNIALAS